MLLILYKIFSNKDYFMNQRNKFNVITLISPVMMIVFSELSFEVSEKYIPMIFVVFIISMFLRNNIRCPSCGSETGKGLIKFGKISFVWWKILAPKKCFNCGYVYSGENKIESSKSQSFKIPKFAIFNIVLGVFVSSFSIVCILISFINLKFSNNIMRINVLWIKYMPFLFFIGLLFFIMGFVLKNSKTKSLRIFISIALIINSILLSFWFILYVLDSRNTFIEIVNGMRMLKYPIKSEVSVKLTHRYQYFSTFAIRF